MSKTETRIAEIKARIEWLCRNLEGCDWCCGGGDQEMDELNEELDKLVDTPAEPQQGSTMIHLTARFTTPHSTKKCVA